MPTTFDPTNKTHRKIMKISRGTGKVIGYTMYPFLCAYCELTNKNFYDVVYDGKARFDAFINRN